MVAASVRQVWPVIAAFGIAATTMLVLHSSAQAQATPIRIMPLGDSITDGYNVPGGYRIDLEDELAADGRAPLTSLDHCRMAPPASPTRTTRVTAAGASTRSAHRSAAGSQLPNRRSSC